MDLSVAPKKRVPTRLDTPLAHSFGFDYGDLQDNRSGFISHWQKKRLRWYLLNNSISILTWVLILSFLPFALLFANLGQYAILPVLWIAGVVLVFGIFWLWTMRSVYRDMQGGKVFELISDIRYERRATSRLGFEKEIDYYVIIGRERFVTTLQQMEAFKEGVQYRIFISPESRQILSAELLTNEAHLHLVDEDEIDIDEPFGNDLIRQKQKENEHHEA